MNTQEYPIVYVEQRDDGVEGYMIKCPYCHKKHYHGLGLGHRVSECCQGNGYILKEKPKEQVYGRKYENHCCKCGISLNSDDHERCDICGNLVCPICSVCSPGCTNSTNQYFGPYFR